MKEVIIYTDGGCRNNGAKENIGAIGVVLMYPEKNHRKEYYKTYKNTTNNQMELSAVIEGLKMLKKPCKVSIHSDSAYVVNAFQKKWIDGWKQKGWTRGKSYELKNKELWKELYELTKIHKVEFQKVKGHADDKYNNRCDDLANIAMDEMIG